MLLTGMIKPESQIRILTSNIPFQSASLPSYKFFSQDVIYAGYMGTVIEIGLFYTKVLSEEGKVIKIPNTILATNSGVVEYMNYADLKSEALKRLIKIHKKMKALKHH
jgi:hypothetical protein